MENVNLNLKLHVLFAYKLNHLLSNWNNEFISCKALKLVLRASTISDCLLIWARSDLTSSTSYGLLVFCGVAIRGRLYNFLSLYITELQKFILQKKILNHLKQVFARKILRLSYGNYNYKLKEKIFNRLSGNNCFFKLCKKLGPV